jgi:hypothetical protein
MGNPKTGTEGKSKIALNRIVTGEIIMEITIIGIQLEWRSFFSVYG